MVQVMNTAVIKSDWVGRTVDGRFPLLECLGDSGTSVVFRTELLEPPAKTAAIRLVPVDAGHPQSLMKDWARAAGLSHPHLMKIFHSGHDEVEGVGLHYVVTEYAEENLAQIIPERPLTPDEVREMLRPVLDALQYLHGRGMVFGHLKPSNIMVVDNLLKLPVDSMAGGVGPKTREAPGIYDAPETANGARHPGVGCVVSRGDRGGSPDPASSSLGEIDKPSAAGAGIPASAVWRHCTPLSALRCRRPGYTGRHQDAA